MPIPLDKLPPEVAPPEPPVILVGLLVVTIMALFGATFAWLTRASGVSSPWDTYIVVFTLLFILLSCLWGIHYLLAIKRFLNSTYVRERYLARGRRSLDVLAASLHSTLRDTDESSNEYGNGGNVARQLRALLQGQKALHRQPPRYGGELSRHSQLPSGADTPQAALLQVFAEVLADLAPTLLQVPDGVPLALLLEADSRLRKEQVDRVWQQAWQASGIRQPLKRVKGEGLAALDTWLDQRMAEQELGLVVAVQIAPQCINGSAEVAVGLLLGDYKRLKEQQPLARLHRPQKVQAAGSPGLLQALELALQWASMPVGQVCRLWRVGLNRAFDNDLMMIRHGSSQPLKPVHDTCNPEISLGSCGKAAHWLPIAAAAQAIVEGDGAQCVLSSAGGNVWWTLLDRAPPRDPH